MALFSFCSRAAAAIKAEALKLSELDGKPGLTADDFKVLVDRVAIVAASFQGTSGADKFTKVLEFLRERFGMKIPAGKWSYVATLIVQGAYQYAKITGKIK